ncbi:MAG TPA: hypothetical protein VHS80_05135, partial [Chthoniobacterales bacterium]|nr:hypothetical protein [Chthoniobacterales bacterium]
DEVSSPILAAIFAIAIAKDELESGNKPEAKSLQRASDLLSGALEKMGEALENNPGDVKPSVAAQQGLDKK